MKPVIFLDFDGVLNNSSGSEHTNTGHINEGKSLKFDPVNVEVLKSLLGKVSADVVICSSWRNDMDLAGLRKLFKDFGLPGDRIVSKTGPVEETRGEEIEKWLNAHPQVNNFVIVDDRDDIDPYSKNHVDSKVPSGLRKRDVDEAVELLESGPRG